MSDSKDKHLADVIDNHSLDRRSFGKILAAGVGSLALPGVAGAANAPCHPKTVDPKRDVDVIVVGAGLSGLIAARELVRAGKTVLVLEANTEIGGRMYGQEISVKNGNNVVKKGYLDFGGQWVGKTQYDMQALVAELNITPFLSYEEGRSILYRGKKKTAFDGDVAHLLEGDCQPPVPDGCTPGSAWKLNPCTPDPNEHEVWQSLLDISATVPPDRPWDAPNATVLDLVTFQEQLDKVGGGRFTDIWLPYMQSHIGGSGGFDPDQVSLLHMAWTQRVAPQSETPEVWLLCGGAGQIPACLAEQIRTAGGRIETKMPVAEIDQREAGLVRVTTASGAKFSAAAIIVAIPPPRRRDIRFSAGMAIAYDSFSRASRMGKMSKVHAVYESAFWREKGYCLSGNVAGDLKTCEFIADSSAPGGEPGILTSFIGGAANDFEHLHDASLSPCPTKADLEKAKARITQAVLNDYVDYFGSEEFRTRVKDFYWMDWNCPVQNPRTEFIGGAFTSYVGKNVWTEWGSPGWRTPLGNVFWAGTEVSDRWPGYFDGAIHAGKVASQQVLDYMFTSSVAAKSCAT